MSKIARTGYGQFASKGLGLKSGESPRQITVAFQPDIDTILRAMDNRSEYIREAVRKQLEIDGLLS